MSQCNEHSCVKQSILVALICLIVFIILLILIFSYHLCNYFGIPYFLKGGYHHDISDSKLIVLIEPVPFDCNFQKRNALSILSTIGVAINVPIKNANEIPNLPYGLEIERVKGTDGNVYAVFFHFPKYAITMLCWINLRYVKQWRCFFQTDLICPSCIFDEEEKKMKGKYWACIHYFYEMVQKNMWKIWNEKFRDRTSQLVIAGHSLGGAMTPICALDFRLHSDVGSEKLFVYISGSPRCGDETFIREFDSLIPNTWNIMNTFDLITLTPPVYSNSYGHVGKIVYFSLPHNKGLGASHLLKTYLEHFQTNGKVVTSC